MVLDDHTLRLNVMQLPGVRKQTRKTFLMPAHLEKEVSCDILGAIYRQITMLTWTLPRDAWASSNYLCGQ